MAIRRPETVKRAGARTTRSRSRLRLHPVPVTRSRTARWACMNLVAEDGEKQARLVAGEGVHAGSRLLDRTAAVGGASAGARTTAPGSPGNSGVRCEGARKCWAGGAKPRTWQPTTGRLFSAWRTIERTGFG